MTASSAWVRSQYIILGKLLAQVWWWFWGCPPTLSQPASSRLLVLEEKEQGAGPTRDGFVPVLEGGGNLGPGPQRSWEVGVPAGVC